MRDNFCFSHVVIHFFLPSSLTRTANELEIYYEDNNGNFQKKKHENVSNYYTQSRPLLTEIKNLFYFRKIWKHFQFDYFFSDDYSMLEAFLFQTLFAQSESSA